MPRAENLGDHLGHAQQGFVFHALGGADDQHLGPKEGNHWPENRRQWMRRHDTDQNLRAGQRFFEIISGAHAGGNFKAGEKEIVLAAMIDGIAYFRFVGPKRNA